MNRRSLPDGVHRQGNHGVDIGDSRQQDEHIGRVGQLSKLRMDAPSSGQFTYSVVQENTVMDRGNVTENEPLPLHAGRWTNSELIARYGDAIVRAQWRTTNQSKP